MVITLDEAKKNVKQTKDLNDKDEKQMKRGDIWYETSRSKEVTYNATKKKLHILSIIFSGCLCIFNRYIWFYIIQS